MSVLIVLIVAIVILSLVFYWSGHYGGRNRVGTTSLRRGANAHTTARGRAKRAYASRDEALAAAKHTLDRDGSVMSAYQCATCAQWHLGHS